MSNTYTFTDPNAKAVYLDIPKGLTPDADALNEFLDPPQAQDEWFLAKEWHLVSQQLIADNKVTADDWQRVRDRVTGAQDGLETWTKLRDPATATDGYGTLSKEMRASGSAAFQSIRQVAQEASRVSKYASVQTTAALGNLCSVLWEYSAFMALELEASKTEVPVQGLLDQVNRRTTGAWSVSVTPSNVSEIKIGSQRESGAANPYGADFWDRQKDTSDTTTTDWTDTLGDGGVGDGGGPEGSEK